jgi:hypothetical protein
VASAVMASRVPFLALFFRPFRLLSMMMVQCTISQLCEEFAPSEGFFFFETSNPDAAHTPCPVM